jgi:hypothetical protein
MRMDVKVSKRRQCVTIATDQGEIEVRVADLPAAQELDVIIEVKRGTVGVETIGATA